MLVHFGESTRPLYGVYDPGASPRKRRGVLILNPWGWEAIRAHRTLRSLAGRLVAKGVDAFRFDYTGTGDSFGDLAEVDVEAWLSDADHALDELRAMAAVTKVAVVGLRLGGLLAAQLAVRRPTDVDRLVLWEPARSGAEFMEWMGGAPKEEAEAFPVPRAFGDHVRGLHLPSDYRGEALVVSSKLDVEFLPGPVARPRLHPSAVSPCWVEDRYNGAGAVPAALIEDISDWLAA